MKKEHISVILVLAALVMWIGQTNAYAKTTIKEIRFESPSKTEDIIIFKMNDKVNTIGKTLPGNNPRVYFDFPDTVPSGKVKNRMPTDGNFIKQIRHAYHKTPKPKTRIVFDLKADKKMAFKQDFNNSTNTLTITLYPAGTKPKHVASKPKPVPPSAKKPSLPKAPEKSVGKKMQPIEDAGIASVPKPKPTPEVKAEPEPKPEPKPVVEKQPEPKKEPETVVEKKPEPVVLPPKTKPAPVEKQPKVASIPRPSRIPERAEKAAEEATVIQPMSEVGVQEKTDTKDSAPVLYSIEYDPKSNRGEMISFKLNGFHPPVIFGIEEDIPRIVCFFKNASAGSELRDIMGTTGQFVKNIRVGKYQNPDNIRVVLELVPGNNYDLQQIFFKDDKVFMLIINKAGKKISAQDS